MKVALFSNYLNHHQLAFCEAMYKLTDHNFVFVAFTPTPGFRRKLGYQEMNDKYPFVLKAYESKHNYAEAVAIACQYDLMIHGSAPEVFIELRLKKKLLTFRYSERIYKNSILHAFSPKRILHRYKNHDIDTKENIYLLCASAYTSFDFMLSRSYMGKAYKWGYFPECLKYNIKELLNNKHSNSILWVGRLIDLKHPDYALLVAEKLVRDNMDFEMDIVGSGELEGKLRDIIEEKHLGSFVHLRGNMPPNEVRRYMEKAEILLFTSDFNEGWGAVLNEAMNSGCTVIASHAIGSVPYLIEDGKNGLIFKNGDIKQLYHLTRMVLERPSLRKQLGEAAYRTILEKWNAETAAERIVGLANDIQKTGDSTRYMDGPSCSDYNQLVV